MGAIEDYDRDRQCVGVDGGYRRGASLELHDVVDPTTERVIAHIAATGMAWLDAPPLVAAAGAPGSRQETAPAANSARKVSKLCSGPGSFC